MRWSLSAASCLSQRSNKKGKGNKAGGNKSLNLASKRLNIKAEVM